MKKLIIGLLIFSFWNFPGQSLAKDDQLKKISEKVLEALYDGDITYIDSIISADGIELTTSESLWRFGRDWETGEIIDKKENAVVFSGLSSIYEDGIEREWQDQSYGAWSTMTFREYLDSVILDEDFRHADLVFYNERVPSRDEWNITDFYPDAQFASYHVRLRDDGLEEYSGLRLVFLPNQRGVLELVTIQSFYTYVRHHPFYSDIIAGTTEYFDVFQAHTSGWISGYPDGTVRLDQTVNRAEFAKMLMLAFDKGEGNTDELAKFPDADREAWYAGVLARAVELVAMSGYPDGTLRPGATINVAEALKMTLELSGPTMPMVQTPWYEPYRQFAAELNLEHMPTDDDQMNTSLTRGQAIELILAVQNH